MGDKTDEVAAAPIFFNFFCQPLSNFDYCYFMITIFRNIKVVFG